MKIAPFLALTLTLSPGLLLAQKAPPKPKAPVAQTDVLDALPTYVGPKKRVGVQDMEVKVTATVTTDPTPAGGTQTTVAQSITPPTDFGQGLTEMLTTALVKTNRFIVLERSDKGLADIQKEQTLQGVSDATRAAANQLMGAESSIRGAITEYAYRRDTGGLGGIIGGLGFEKGSTTASVTIDVRLYDNSTGEIYASEKAEGRCKSTGQQIGFEKGDIKFHSEQFTNSPLGQASREAIQKAVFFICQHMDTRPWEGRVADVVDDENNQKELYLTVGSAQGIKIGDEFDVFHAGRVLIDPDNPGRVIGKTKGKYVGKCKVTQVEKNLAVAVPTSGEGFAARDVIRLPNSVPVFTGVATGAAAPSDKPAVDPNPLPPANPAPAPQPGQPAPGNPPAPDPNQPAPGQPAPGQPMPNPPAPDPNQPAPNPNQPAPGTPPSNPPSTPTTPPK